MRKIIFIIGILVFSVISVDLAVQAASTVSVATYGAVDDAQEYFDGYISGSLPNNVTINSPSANFISSDIGKLVYVRDSCINAGVASTLEGTIASITSANKAVLTLDTSSPQHGIQCAALNSNPVLGHLNGAINNVTTSIKFFLNSGTTMPAVPFSLTLDQANAASETVTVTAVTNPVPYLYQMTVVRGAVAYAHNNNVEGFLSGTQAVQWAFGTDDTAAINNAIAYAESISSAGNQVNINFPSDTGGYMIRPQNKTIAGYSLYINGSNLNLNGSAWLYNSGAWSLVSGNVVRGDAIKIGTVGGTYTNITIQGLNFEGFTDGNDDLGYTFPGNTLTGDGWDTTDQGISSNDTYTSGVVISGITMQNFLAEEIIFNGSGHNGLIIENSTFSNTNGDNISTNDHDLTAINNNLSNAGNACFEDSMDQNTVYQTYKNNKCVGGFRHDICLVEVDNTVASNETITIQNNDLEKCGVTQAVGVTNVQNACIRICDQTVSTAMINNIQVLDNTMKDFGTAMSVETALNLLVTGNNFIVDTIPNSYAGINLWTCQNCQITANSFTQTNNAQTNGYSFYPIDEFEGWLASPNWNNVVVKNNVFNSGAGILNYLNNGQLAETWATLTNQIPNWQGNSYRNAPFSSNTDEENLSSSLNVVYPFSDNVAINPNSALTATIATNGVQDGMLVHITNISSYATTFAPSNIINIPSSITLQQNQGVSFMFNANTGQWTLSTVLWGDVNGDGAVNMDDAELAAQYALGTQVSNFNVAAAEVDGKTSVDIYDAYLISEFAVGTIKKFPVNNS